MNWGVRGAARSRQGRNNLSSTEMLTDAVTGCLDDAGMDSCDVGAVVVANNGSYWDGQPSVAAQSWLHPIEFDGAQVFNVENACAGGGTAMHLGTTLLQADRGPVLVAGVERMYVTDQALVNLQAATTTRDLLFGVIEGGINQRLRDELKEQYDNDVRLGVHGAQRVVGPVPGPAPWPHTRAGRGRGIKGPSQRGAQRERPVDGRDVGCRGDGLSRRRRPDPNGDVRPVLGWSGARCC